MFVRLWAGPSCIWRAISRRMSSWAVRIIRETPGGSGPPCSTLRSSGVAVGRALVPACRCRRRRPPGSAGERRGPASACAAIASCEPRRGLALALEEVDLGLHQRGLAGDGDELVGELGELLGRRRRRRSRAARRPSRSFSAAAVPARLVAGRLGLGLVDEELDLLDLALDGRSASAVEARGEIGGGEEISPSGGASAAPAGCGARRCRR